METLVQDSVNKRMDKTLLTIALGSSMHILTSNSLITNIGMENDKHLFKKLVKHYNVQAVKLEV